MSNQLELETFMYVCLCVTVFPYNYAWYMPEKNSAAHDTEQGCTVYVQKIDIVNVQVDKT